MLKYINAKPSITVNSFPNLSYFNPITSNKIILELQSMNSHKSTPKNCTPIKFFKMTSFIITLISTELFNRCVPAGFFLDILKAARITLDFKKESQILVCSNYQPISLLRLISKIFEICVYSCMYSFLFTSNQYREKIIPHLKF